MLRCASLPPHWLTRERKSCMLSRADNPFFAIIHLPSSIKRGRVVAKRVFRSFVIEVQFIESPSRLFNVVGMFWQLAAPGPT
jgi:hypothetical protein